MPTVGPTRGPFVFKPSGEPAKKSEYESVTSLQKFRRCPVIYHEHYAHKFREPISKELIFGRAYHGTVEDALVEKMFNGLNMHPDALQQRWHQRWLMELFLTREEFEWKGMPGESPEDFFNIGSALVADWREKYLPALKPLKTEGSFWLPLRGVKRALYGKFDLITVDGMLVDHKTSSHTWEQLTNSRWFDQSEIDLQMCIYHAAYEVLVKDWPKSCELHRAVTKAPFEVERIALNYTPEEVQKMFDKTIKPAIKEIESMWESGVFPCRCGKHKDTPATAPRPLVLDGGAAAGTTEGPVEMSDSLIDKVNRGIKKVKENPSFNRTPLPPVEDFEELPF